MHKRWVTMSVALLLIGGVQGADEPKRDAGRKPTKETASFGTLESMSPEVARTKALEWLKTKGKSDADTEKEFDAIWGSDRSLLDKVADTFALGDSFAARALAEARNPTAPAPTAVPNIIKDLKSPTFFRANLALAYSRALINRRIHEEALTALKLVRPEQVVDPASYLFHRAVAEHALLMADEANRSILRLLDDVTDAPDRYRTVAALMHFDVLTWREKDLGWISRMMSSIERRLELQRGGPQTQEMQKKVVMELDRMIKEEEERQQQQQQQQQEGQGRSRQGQPGNTNRPSSPQNDSYGGQNSGPGNVDPKKFKELSQVWGKLPEKERAKAILELTREMPPKHRELIEAYFRKLAQAEPPAGR